MKHILVYILVLMSICGFSQNNKKNMAVYSGSDAYEDIGKFLKQYPIERYQVRFNDCQTSSVNAAELMTLLRSRRWKEEDVEQRDSYREGYASISIKAKGNKGELILAVCGNGIMISNWTPTHMSIKRGAFPIQAIISCDGYGNYGQQTMYYELVSKIDEIMFRTIADFKNIDVVDTLRVVANRIDHSVGGIVESITMTDEDSREYICLLNHGIFSIVHQGGSFSLIEPSGVEYGFTYGQTNLSTIGRDIQPPHEWVECKYSREDAKSIDSLRSKYIGLLDSIEHKE